MSWTMLMAMNKKDIARKIRMHEKQQLNPTIEKSLKLADEKYRINQLISTEHFEDNETNRLKTSKFHSKFHFEDEGE